MTNYQNQVSRYSSHFLSPPFNTEHTFNQPVVVLLSDVAIISSLNFNNSLHTIEQHMAENPSDEPFWHQPTTLLPPHFIPPTILDTENQFEHTKPRAGCGKAGWRLCRETYWLLQMYMTISLNKIKMNIIV